MKTTIYTELEKQALLTEAKALSASVAPNKISMQDIVEEARKVRSQRQNKLKIQ